ncbi:MAG: hypothetical protein AAGA56_07405 [Myxococcota bacterium]
MHIMLEVYLSAGASGEGLLTQETLDDTQAQVMTAEQAAAVGFSGLPEPAAPGDRRFIIATKSDERRLMNALEASAQVAQFRSHDVNL